MLKAIEYQDALRLCHGLKSENNIKNRFCKGAINCKKKMQKSANNIKNGLNGTTTNGGSL